MKGSAIGLVFFLLGFLGFGGAGAFILWRQSSGPEVSVSVTRCERGRRSFACYGTWTEGSLLAGGRVQRGIVEGASEDDVGKTIQARAHDDRAYAPTLRLPIVFFVLAGLFAAGIAQALLKPAAPRKA